LGSGTNVAQLFRMGEGSAYNVEEPVDLISVSMHIQHRVSGPEAIYVALVLSLEVIDVVLDVWSRLVLEEGFSSFISEPFVVPFFLALLFGNLFGCVVWSIGGFLWHSGSLFGKFVCNLVSLNTTMGWDPLGSNTRPKNMLSYSRYSYDQNTEEMNKNPHIFIT